MYPLLLYFLSEIDSDKYFFRSDKKCIKCEKKCIFYFGYGQKDADNVFFIRKPKFG